MQSNYKIPIYLSGREGHSANQFEAILIVPNKENPSANLFYAPGQPDPDFVYVYTSYDDVLSGSFEYPFWHWTSAKNEAERDEYWKDLTDTGKTARLGTHLYVEPAKVDINAL